MVPNIWRCCEAIFWLCSVAHCSLSRNSKGGISTLGSGNTGKLKFKPANGLRKSIPFPASFPVKCIASVTYCTLGEGGSDKG